MPIELKVIDLREWLKNPMTAEKIDCLFCSKPATFVATDNDVVQIRCCAIHIEAAEEVAKNWYLSRK